MVCTKSPPHTLELWGDFVHTTAGGCTPVIPIFRTLPHLPQARANLERTKWGVSQAEPRPGSDSCCGALACAPICVGVPSFRGCSLWGRSPLCERGMPTLMRKWMIQGRSRTQTRIPPPTHTRFVRCLCRCRCPGSLLQMSVPEPLPHCNAFAPQMSCDGAQRGDKRLKPGSGLEEKFWRGRIGEKVGEGSRSNSSSSKNDQKTKNATRAQQQQQQQYQQHFPFTRVPHIIPVSLLLLFLWNAQISSCQASSSQAFRAEGCSATHAVLHRIPCLWWPRIEAPRICDEKGVEAWRRRLQRGHTQGVVPATSDRGVRGGRCPTCSAVATRGLRPNAREPLPLRPSQSGGGTALPARRRLPGTGPLGGTGLWHTAFRVLHPPEGAHSRSGSPPHIQNEAWLPSSCGGGGGDEGGFGLGQRLPWTPRSTVSATVPARLDWVGVLPAVAVSRRTGLLTAPEPRGDTAVPVCVAFVLLGCLWVWGRGEAHACGVVCRLVLQAPAGRQWAPAPGE